LDVNAAKGELEVSGDSCPFFSIAGRASMTESVTTRNPGLRGSVGLAHGLVEYLWRKHQQNAL